MSGFEVSSEFVTDMLAVTVERDGGLFGERVDQVSERDGDLVEVFDMVPDRAGAGRDELSAGRLDGVVGAPQRSW